MSLCMVYVPGTCEVVTQLETDLSRTFRMSLLEDGLSFLELRPVDTGEIVGRHEECVR